MEIVVVGLNHRTAPVDLRERVAFTPQQARNAADQLRSEGVLEEALILSTCNRSEIYGAASGDSADSGMVVEQLEDFFASFHGLSPSELQGAIFTA
jgi:glutamyl-tRNA reductase